MDRQILFSLKSPYREPLEVVGFRFGCSKKSAAIVGATRGNEVQQMYVCAKLVKKMKQLEEEGKIAKDKGILIVPCINYYSMNIGKRFWTMDNTDINRMFPGYNLGETTQRIAAGIFEQLQGFEYGIQLASFYQKGKFIPHVKMMDTGFNDAKLMKGFGLQYGIVRTPRPYDTTTLNYNWQIWETNSFSLYTGETDRIDEASACDAVTAVLRFMAGMGIISYKTPCGYNTEIINESGTFQVHSKTGGIFKPLAKPGDMVEKGELLGEIKDPLDCEIKERLYSEETGIIYFSYDRPLVNENTVCWKIIAANE
ncbi:MAG: M14 family metallopeptidase [Eubacterium sp.]|nr:M14 family metallopeptidase [Eubacterium sp.]